ncbi:glycosyltransferase family 9 protein [candidate division KSB1 bacterium]
MKKAGKIHHKDLHRFLLVRTDRIGDVILSTPVAAALKTAFPHAHITLLARDLTRVIGERNRWIDRVITLEGDPDGGQNFFDLVSILRKESFDCAVVLHPTLRLAALLYFAGIPYRIGTAYRLYSFLFNVRHREHRKISTRHEVEYNLGLLEPLNVSVSEPQFHFDINDEDNKTAEEILGRLPADVRTQFCVVHPGSGGSAADWPTESFASACELFSRELHIPSIVTWGPGEQSHAEKIAETSGGAAVMLPDILPLPALAALLKRAVFVLAPSTGILHLANVAGSPVIGLYPSVPHMSPRRWGPFGQLENALVPETGDAVGKGSGSAALDTISPEKVFDTARRIVLKRK